MLSNSLICVLWQGKEHADEDGRDHNCAETQRVLLRPARTRAHGAHGARGRHSAHSGRPHAQRGRTSRAFDSHSTCSYCCFAIGCCPRRKREDRHERHEYIEYVERRTGGEKRRRECVLCDARRAPREWRGRWRRS